MRSLLVSAFLLVMSSSAMAQDFDTGPCTPCGQGATPLTEKEGCTNLEAPLAGLVGTDTTCLNQQLVNFQIGCCQTAPFGYCTICPDGSTPPGLQNPVPTGEFAEGQDPTCEEWQFQPNSLTALFTDGDCSDTFIQRASFYCDCPGVEQECWLCPDKQPPTNPERGEAWATNSNCRGLEFLFSTMKANECTVVPQTFGIDFAAFCKCNGVEEPEEDACSFCPNGGTVTNPEDVYTDENAVFERKCRQAYEFAKYITTGPACNTLLLEAREVCKCSGGPSSSTMGGFASGMLIMMAMMVTMVVSILW